MCFKKVYPQRDFDGLLTTNRDLTVTLVSPNRTFLRISKRCDHKTSEMPYSVWTPGVSWDISFHVVFGVVL